MKIALAQLNYHIGNFEANVNKIVSAIATAKSEGADLVVFAELAICGYPPRDFLEFEDFIDLCESSIREIASHCKGIAAIVGAPSRNTAKKGKALYNSAYFLAEGAVQSVHHKSLLPTYDVFDEYRYFQPSDEVKVLKYQGKRIALTICEDVWNVKGSYLYARSPMKKLVDKKVDFIINIAASPFSESHDAERRRVFEWNCKKYGLPLYYVNHIGAQTELIFDGGSLVMNKKGGLVQSAGFFEEQIIYSDTEEAKQEEIQETPSIERIHQALVLGIKDYFRKLNFKKATLGLSGGIDSAVTLALAVEALGAENVTPILMPSAFSSEHSVEDSLEMCRRLGCEEFTIPIHEIYDAFNKALAPVFEGRPFDLTEENIQARSRGTLLMAYTNKFGAILLNTSNKSEMAVGYGTLYGDMCGGLSVIGDVYKTAVYALAKHLNQEGEIIPENIITKPPSAELRPDQKDSDSLPDYEILDQILIEYIENTQSPSDIIAQGFDAATVKKVLRLTNINEYKRFQAPPILRISEKAFGMGRRMPIVGKYLA